MVESYVNLRGFELSESVQVLGSSPGWTATQKTETGADLLARIRAEKADLIRQGKLRKEKPLPLITDAEKPFVLPEGWVWCRLSEVTELITDGDHQAPPKSKDGIPFIVISNIKKNKIIFNSTRFVPENYCQSLSLEKRPKQGDILYTVTGSFGIPVLITDSIPFCFQRHIGLIRPVDLVVEKYLFYLLQSTLVYNQAKNVAWGIAQLTVPLSGLRNFVIPLPLLSEQQAIVSHIEQLLEQISALETENKQQQTEVERLMQEVLREAFAGKETAEPVISE